MSNTDIGKRLKKVLKMRGINASQMSVELGISRGHVSNIMTGRINNPQKHLAKIADYLRVSATWLLTGEGSPDVGFNGLTSQLSVFTMKNFTKSHLGVFQISGMAFTNEHYGLVHVPGILDNKILIMSPCSGDGYYLVKENDKYFIAQRNDKISHVEWYYLLEAPKEPLVVGKIEAIINKELVTYHEA